MTSSKKLQRIISHPFTIFGGAVLAVSIIYFAQSNIAPVYAVSTFNTTVRPTLAPSRRPSTTSTPTPTKLGTPTPVPTPISNTNLGSNQPPQPLPNANACSVSVSFASPSPTTITCGKVSFYSTSWALLTGPTFNSYKAGSQLYLCVSSTGPVTKARFSVDNIMRPEVTFTHTVGSDNLFCDLYTIPPASYSFNVKAQVFNQSTGWQ